MDLRSKGFPAGHGLGKATVVFLCLILYSFGHLEGQVGYGDAERNITMALAGDAIITRQLSVYSEPAFLRVRDLFRKADVGFANLEILFHAYEEDVIPAAESGGTHMAADPALAHELGWMGLNMVSRANNHTMDYGVGGMRATTRAVEAAGLRHAGAGENLALARAPAYLETPGGRVALISVASSFAEHMRAGHQRRDLRGRPGLSPLRYETIQLLPESDIRSLAAIVGGRMGMGVRERGDTVTMLGRTFLAAPRPGTVTRLHQRDLEEILEVVRAARRQADWVVVTSHTHEAGETREVPADFLVEFARRVIDAGADVFTGHGPHTLRGIEIYRGKPILYSLADFIYQNETVSFLPADSYENLGLPPDALPPDWYDARAELPGRSWRRDVHFYDSAVAVVDFRNGELHEVRLHPLVLGHGTDRSQRGRPLHASGDDARRVIETLQRLSEPFGTEIHLEAGIGVIRGPGTRGPDRQ